MPLPLLVLLTVASGCRAPEDRVLEDRTDLVGVPEVVAFDASSTLFGCVLLADETLRCWGYRRVYGAGLDSVEQDTAETVLRDVKAFGVYHDQPRAVLADGRAVAVTWRRDRADEAPRIEVVEAPGVTDATGVFRDLVFRSSGPALRWHDATARPESLKPLPELTPGSTVSCNARICWARTGEGSVLAFYEASNHEYTFARAPDLTDTKRVSALGWDSQTGEVLHEGGAVTDVTYRRDWRDPEGELAFYPEPRSAPRSEMERRGCGLDATGTPKCVPDVDVNGDTAIARMRSLGSGLRMLWFNVNRACGLRGTAEIWCVDLDGERSTRWRVRFERSEAAAGG